MLVSLATSDDAICTMVNEKGETFTAESASRLVPLLYRWNITEIIVVDERSMQTVKHWKRRYPGIKFICTIPPHSTQGRAEEALNNWRKMGEMLAILKQLRKIQEELRRIEEEEEEE